MSPELLLKTAQDLRNTADFLEKKAKEIKLQSAELDSLIKILIDHKNDTKKS